MVADPNAMPFSLGWEVGAVAPAGMETFGVTVTFDGLLLARVMKTPPAGAGAPRVTAKGADSPTFTVAFAGKRMPPAVFVSEKLAGVATPVTDAVTV